MKTAFVLATAASADDAQAESQVHIPKTDASESVPAGAANQDLFQETLDQVNQYRQHHCAEPYKWSSELARNAKIIADCWAEDCSASQRMHSTKSWLSFSTSEDVLDNAVVESGDDAFLGLDAAVGGWYEAGEAGESPTIFEMAEDMVENVRSKGPSDLSNLYVSLVWRGGLNMGCAVSENPERAPAGTVIEKNQETPTKSKIVCVFQGLLVGPGALAPAESQDVYQYFRKELYPYQSDLNECAKAEYTPKTLFRFDSDKDAFLQTVNLYRAHTCTPPVQWDESLAAGVKKVMDCYKDLAPKTGITGCTKAYENAFPSNNNGQYASILARTDYCDESNAGCGIAFNLSESRALLGVFHWFNRFKVETGVDAKELNHATFLEIFEKLSDDKKKDLNTFVILNWKNNKGIYCDIQDTHFESPNDASVMNSYIVCAVRTNDDSRPPGYEVQGEDRYEEWEANLFPGSGCHKKAGADATADATASTEEDEYQNEEEEDAEDAEADADADAEEEESAEDPEAAPAADGEDAEAAPVADAADEGA